MHDIQELTDAQLFDWAASKVSVPRRDVSNSFVLHAPLELMARRLLLPHVPERFRPAVRERIVGIAEAYERAGEPVEASPARAFASVDDARQALVQAVGDGDLDTVDLAATHFLDEATLDEVMTLANPVLDSLAAAGHAPIGFFFASRLAATSRAALSLLRPTLRELARGSGLELHWVREVETSGGDDLRFAKALAETPRLGLPNSDFIFPIVNQVDEAGIARDVIDGTIPSDTTSAAAVSLRIAARSMLQDDRAFAPYGWTHCLTLPQAIFEIMPWLPDTRRAAAIAATYVVAFRAAEGREALDTNWVPGPTTVGLVDALDAEPTVAAGAWYHASDARRAEAVPELIGRAASHKDAHVVKYTLACMAAAERDRVQRSLYIAAAAFLAAWWAANPAAGFDDGS